MTLAVRHLPGRDGEVAGRLEARPGRLARHVEADAGREVGGAGRGLDVRREADADVPALGERPGLHGPERREVGELDRALEGLVRGDLVERRAREHLDGLLLAADEVDPPELLGREGELAGDLVEHPVADPRLRDPRAPVRDVARLVRRDDRRVEAVRLQPVRRREQRPDEQGPERARERRHRVRALIEDHADAQTEEATVARDRGVDLEDLVARVAGDHQVLAALLDPLDGPAEELRRRAERNVLAGDLPLRAERAADVARDATDVAVGDVEQLRHREAERVRALVRDVVGEGAGDRLVVRDAAAGLERRVADAVLDEAARHDEIGAGEHLVDRPPLRGVAVDDVVAPLVEERRRRRVERVLHVDDRSERLVVDLDEVAAVGGGGERLADHDGDRLAHAPHPVGRQRPHRRHREPGRPDDRRRLGHPVELGGRDDRDDARMGPRRCGVDRTDPRVGVRAAHERGVQHPGPVDRAGEAVRAGEEPGVLDPFDALTGEAGHDDSSDGPP